MSEILRDGGQPAGVLHTRRAQMEGVLTSLCDRAKVLRSLIDSRLIAEPWPERLLPVWRRWGRRLLAWLGWRLPQVVRTRAATSTELLAAAEELDRAEDAIARLKSALERLPEFPVPTDPRHLQTDERGYPADWEAISLTYRQAVGFVCERCGTHAPDGHVHHMHPVSRGGGSDQENLLFLCTRCHMSEHPHMREV